MFVILTVFINDLERKETTEEAQLSPLAQATEQDRTVQTTLQQQHYFS